MSILPFVVFTLFFGPLPEELGWRGYVLDRLQERYGAFSSSLVLGIAWGAWHLPLFFIKGSYQHGLGVATKGFWLFLTGVVSQSVLVTWVYDNNKRSTLSAVLFHFMVNLVGELLELTVRADLFYGR